MSSENYFGFMGKLIKVDLSKEIISIEKLNQEIAANFMGGAGYAVSYLYHHLTKELDPFSPENIFMIMTGPLCLTGAPSFSRFVICSKSPYTGLWGEANAGGFFGPELKKAGYDGIIIKGKAEAPVFLKIWNNKIDLVDATQIWGQGTKKTHEYLKKSIGDLNSRVLCIGPAGENLVLFAIVHSEGRSAGRTGMGAIMGSKNLKGIVVKGEGKKPKIALSKEFNEEIKKTLKYVLNVQTTKNLRTIGTSSGVRTAYESGDLPIKYWSKGEWKDYEKITGERLHKIFKIKKSSCYGCGIACGKKILDFESELIKGEQGMIEAPEYETIAGFGSMILNNNLHSIVLANYLCNDLGVDTISTSSLIAFLYSLFNEGILNRKNVDGLDLSWGNHESMLKLIEKIAYRQDIGDILAQGSNHVGKYFKISQEKIATVNNLEVPYHDVRHCYGQSLTYAFAPRGACHTTGDLYKALNKKNDVDFSSLGIKKMDLYRNDEQTARAAVLLHDYRALYSSLICCFFSNPPPINIARLIQYLMGYEKFEIKDMMKIGERIFTLKRLFNIKIGLTAKDDSIPPILLVPKQEGTEKGKFPDFKKLKSYYYGIRKWDPHTGKPTNEKLMELDLSEFKPVN
ncbi:MAG: aldehyde ferredoxin oxidoreductase family protein [Promethearchaeota archaeon]